jgi:hypothetical protein
MEAIHDDEGTEVTADAVDEDIDAAAGVGTSEIDSVDRDDEIAVVEEFEATGDAELEDESDEDLEEDEDDDED